MFTKSIFCSCHGKPEVFGVGEYLLLVGILLLLDGALDDDCQCQCVDGQGYDGDYAPGHRIGQSGTDSGVHKAVSVQGGDSGKYAGILEQREYLGEHTPQGQGVGPVLNPATLVPQGVSQRFRHKFGIT